MKRREYTIKEVNYLKANIHLTDKQLAKDLNRDRASIKNARWRYKISKQVNRGSFKKGSTPWNKGIEYRAGGKSISTQFKKGYTKPNERPMYTVFEQKEKDKKKHLFIKLPTNRQYPYSRYVWEHKTGKKLKTGEIIRFKDSNPLNCSFKNLIRMTRSENAQKNINRSKGGESLRKVWAVVKTFEDFGLTPPYKFRSKRRSA